MEEPEEQAVVGALITTVSRTMRRDTPLTSVISIAASFAVSLVANFSVGDKEKRRELFQQLEEFLHGACEAALDSTEEFDGMIASAKADLALDAIVAASGSKAQTPAPNVFEIIETSPDTAKMLVEELMPSLSRAPTEVGIESLFCALVMLLIHRAKRGHIADALRELEPVHHDIIGAAIGKADQLEAAADRFRAWARANNLT